MGGCFGYVSKERGRAPNIEERYRCLFILVGGEDGTLCLEALKY
jgi:hypothetical protein